MPHDRWRLWPTIAVSLAIIATITLAAAVPDVGAWVGGWLALSVAFGSVWAWGGYRRNKLKGRR